MDKSSVENRGAIHNPDPIKDQHNILVYSIVTGDKSALNSCDMW